MALISGADIKLVGTHVGVTLAADGPSQMALADIAFMRALRMRRTFAANPAVTVLTPSDAVSAYALVLAMAAHPGACYLRAVRADLPILYRESEPFPFGGFKVLRRARTGRRPVLLAASGYMVHSCLAAADGCSSTASAPAVVDAYCCRSTAALPIWRGAKRAPILTVEDNYVGGLASELAEAAAGRQEAPLVRSLTVRNFPKSGRTADDVLGYVHLSVAEIVTVAVKAAR